jgi:rSAM/selenodomain-associated transferase 1
MPYKYPDSVLMIFCKAPIAGQVKTRLTTELTEEQAMQLHIELTHKTIKLAMTNKLCPVQIWYTPSNDPSFFTELAQAYPIALYQQQGEDLGDRMNNAFDLALKNYERALLIGCDCPSLTGQDLDEALTALSQKRCCVLAPAEDGGYVLIGLNQHHPELFNDIPWGTDKVLEKTCIRIKQNNLYYHALNEQWDIDTPSDLTRYLALNMN